MTAALSEIEIADQVIVRGRPPAGFPSLPNTTAIIEGRRVLWLGPEEWLVLDGREVDYPDADAAVDVSSNRACLDLSGPGAHDVLAQGCSLDLHPVAFAEGACAQTLLARVQVILFRSGRESWLILVRPSFVSYLHAWLTDAVRGLAAT